MAVAFAGMGRLGCDVVSMSRGWRDRPTEDRRHRQTLMRQPTFPITRPSWSHGTEVQKEKFATHPPRPASSAAFLLSEPQSRSDADQTHDAPVQRGPTGPLRDRRHEEIQSTSGQSAKLAIDVSRPVTTPRRQERISVAWPARMPGLSRGAAGEEDRPPHCDTPRYPWDGLKCRLENMLGAQARGSRSRCRRAGIQDGSAWRRNPWA